MSTLGQDQHILVTGANGFVASHILSLLLDRNVRVTGTVRSQDKAAAIIKAHPSWKDRLAFVVVSDFTSVEAFDTTFKNAEIPFTHIIHTASPLDFTMTDIYKDMIEPAVKGTTAILSSACRYGGPNLKRIVILSSAVCVLNSFEDLTREGRPYTEDDWNPVTAEQAIKLNSSVLGYNVSKTQAEAAAWDFMKTESPSFDLTVINPDVILGPMMHPISGPRSINESNRFGISNFLDGIYTKTEDVRYPFYHFVDVRDVATAHVEALMNPAAGGRRIVLVSELFTPQLVANIIRENFPTLKDRVHEGNPSQILPIGVHPTGWNIGLSLDVLNKGTAGGEWKYIGLKASVIDTVKSLLEKKVI